jgi:putative protease
MTVPNLPHVPELLAPAGDEEALRAAVANGADAVYFGLSDFNARHRATNFTLEQLPETMQYLHENNVRGYVTFNTLVFSDELPRAVEFLTAIIRAGADAFIVQDLGIVRLIKRLAPGFPVHGSTQMTLSEARGIEFVRRLGVERVILARELSTKEIGRITAETPMPLEVFVHGALCVAYSGQCLTSEALGGRSANRGQCAQACRQPYQLLVDGKPVDLGDKAYLLSPQDLAAYDLVGDLAKLGVTSLKIEGRLKSAHYVAATTQAYRAALDATKEGRPFQITPRQELDLTQSFSRGFTHGFLDGVNHQELVEGRFPKNRGVRIGTVAAVLPDGVLVEVDPKLSGMDIGEELPLKPGDGVVFDEGHPEQDEQGGRVFSVESIIPPLRKGGLGGVNQASTCSASPDMNSGDWGSELNEGAGDAKTRGTSNVRGKTPPAPPLRRGGKERNTVLEDGQSKGGAPPPRPRLLRGRRTAPSVHAPRLFISFGRGDVNLAAISLGATMWRTDDPAFRRRLEQSFAADKVLPRIPLSLEFKGDMGSTLRVTGRDDSGTTAEVVWEQPLAEARKHALTQDLVREQFGRLGGTPFHLADVTFVNRSGTAPSLPVMVPKSVLNDLRRRLVAQLLESRRKKRSASTVNSAALDELRSMVPACRFAAADPKLSILCRNLEQLRAVLDWDRLADALRPVLVYCDFEEVRLSKEAVALAKEAGVPVALATPRIIKPGEEGLLLQIAHCRPDKVLVRNLAAISFFRERFPDLGLVGDYSLNVANELTAALFAEAGLAPFVPSYDLNLEQLQAMFERVDPGLFEIVLHQHIPMFHMEHCIYSHVLSNGKDFHDCGRPCDRHKVELRDHVGEAHPLAADVGCRNTLFNAHAQSAAPYVPRLREWGASRFRVELLLESAAETQALLTSYARVLSGLEAGPRVWRELKVLNQVGITRGTLEFQ